MRRARADWTGIRMPGRAAIRVRVEHADDAGHPRLVRPATGIAGERDGAVRRAVVRPVAHDDLVAARVEARKSDRVLVRLRAGVREEGHTQVSGGDLREQAPEPRAGLVRHRRADGAQLVRLLLDRGDDLRVLMADRDVYELGGEVEVALAVVVPEVAAFRTGDGDRVDRVLHRPAVEDELLRVGDDLVAQVGLRRRHRRIVTRFGACERKRRAPS